MHPDFSKQPSDCYWVEGYRSAEYRVPLIVQDGEIKMYAVLGRIKQKNDNRWNYWRCASKEWAQFWLPKQGTVMTREEAVAAVLLGWKSAEQAA